MTASLPSRRWQPRAPGVAWTTLGAVLLLGSLGVTLVALLAALEPSPSPSAWAGLQAPPLTGAPEALAGPLAWRIGAWDGQIWRWWTAAFVHLSGLHLAANLAGGLLVVALGRAGRLPASAALAWLLAWPLTHLGLLVLAPALGAYGGLSGVLHAGVACAAVFLIRGDGPAPAEAAEGAGAGAVACRAPSQRLGWLRGQRAVGGALLLVLLGKVLLEQPWIGGGAARAAGGWDIPVASAAHASGLLAGLACGLLALAAGRPTRAP